MRILCTHPGRFGDILWALPTVRAISRAYGEPVDFLTSAKYEAIRPLIDTQPYIACTGFDPAWQVVETAPISPREPPGAEVYAQDVLSAEGQRYYDHVFHLGYEGWPEPRLADDVYNRTRRQADAALPPLDLDEPWIYEQALVQKADRPRVWVGWSEEHFELKVGLLVTLAARFQADEFWWIRPWGGRYDEVDKTLYAMGGMHRLGPNVVMLRAHWGQVPSIALSCHVFLGCLSAPWVLANGLGIRTVIVEPNAQRHHPVFWRESPKNRLVLGGDGLPTFDARHVGDALEAAMREELL